MKLSFIFSNPKNPTILSDIIKEVENTPFCHFNILLETEEKGAMIYEAVFPKSHKISLSEWSQNSTVHTKFDIEIPTHQKYIEVLEFLDTLLNKWYAFDQLIYIALHLWFRISGKMSLNRSKYLICTELGFLFCKKFFDFQWRQESQDVVDLKDMFLICNRISNETKWL